MSNAIQSGASLALTQANNTSLMSRFLHRPQAQTSQGAAKDFEAMFLSQMLQPMFDTVSVDPLFGGGHGEEMMRGFLVQEYGKALARSSHFGIAEAVEKEMQHSKTKQSNPMPITQKNGAIDAAGSAVE